MNGIGGRSLRGLSFRERFRIMSLARSGKEVADPEDARRVETFLRSELSPRAYHAWRWALPLPLLLAAVFVWWAISGEWPIGGAFAGMGVPLGALIGATWARRRYRATARANGWEI
jgi:hypothetical protein